MPLLTLETERFRNLRQLRLACAAQLNLVLGDNASGKTSLLEAIYFLGRAKSFRAGRTAELVQHGEKGFRVVGMVGEGDGRRVPLGVQREGEVLEVRIAGQAARSLAELAQALPLLLLTPDSHRLLDAGPRHRRRFLDWGLFQADARFIVRWRRYEAALHQRNAALRQSGVLRTIVAWEEELAHAATALDAARRGFCTELEGALAPHLVALLGPVAVTLDYRRGWHHERELAEVLAEGREIDRRFGHTRSGPHRADFVVRLDSRPSTEALSRGQHKLLVTALVLAQAELYRRHRDAACTLLVDDLPAELDRTHRGRVMRRLAEVGAQVFVTAIEPDGLDEGVWGSRAVFRLERGILGLGSGVV